MPDNLQLAGYGNNTWAAVIGKGLFVLVFLLWVLAGVYIYSQIGTDINIFQIIVISILLVFVTVLALYDRHLRNELERVHRIIDQVSSVDELTRLFNRKHFLTLFEKEMAQALRHDRKICCLLADIDHFKNINEKYGTDFGDSVIRNVADILTDNLRIGDLVGRYESNKFICALPETDTQSCMILSKRVRSLVEGTNFSDDRTGEVINITISIGVSSWEPGQNKETDITKMINVAEKALASAKEGGRNRVESSPV
jgi:diguanylate cyclase (GGDEF)-like protein